MTERHDSRRVRRTFRYSDVLSDTFTLFFRHFPALVGISLAVYLPVLIHSAFAVAQFASGEGAELNPVDATGVVMAIVQFFFLQPLSTAIICLAVFHALREQPITFRESAARGLRRVPAVLGVAILQSLAIAPVAFAVGVVAVVATMATSQAGQAGALLMILAMILAVAVALAAMLVIAVMLYVSVPAVVTEASGAVNALRRSVALTKGARVPVGGVFLTVLLLSLGVGMVVGGLQAGLTMGMSNQVIGFAAGTFGTDLVGAAANAFAAVAMTVCYYRLRCAKEGLDVETLAAAFDEESAPQ